MPVIIAMPKMLRAVPAIILKANATTIPIPMSAAVFSSVKNNGLQLFVLHAVIKSATKSYDKEIYPVSLRYFENWSKCFAHSSYLIASKALDIASLSALLNFLSRTFLYFSNAARASLIFEIFFPLDF